jgi:hypothetical protein
MRRFDPDPRLQFFLSAAALSVLAFIPRYPNSFLINA